MAQYTSTFTSPFDGTITNSVLDSVTNQTTITVTTRTGKVATVSVDSDLANANGPYSYNIDNLVSNLARQLNEQGADLGLRGITSGIVNTTNSVNQQVQQATGVALATGNPPPAERQAIPTNSTVDPAVPPATAEPDVEESSNIGTEIEVEEDPEVAFYQEQQRINESINDPLTTPPGTDEFDGLDTQIENNENGLQEPPLIDTEQEPEFVYTPLETPPDPNPDEFGGLDAAIAANENGLQEPPALTPEETEQALNNIEAPPEPAPVTSDEIIASSNYKGLAAKTNAQIQATAQDQVQFTKQEDWRVRLSLTPNANYLYKAKDPGILKPLAATGGVIFPYTPSIQINYAANYDATDLVHANYKVYQYKNSGVDNIQISCDFTAQDTYEANYLLAVIHFLRSVTKMFYGQDNGPKPGTPPPLCFLTGLGAFQFNEHPLAIVSFNYNLPTDVDYIRAGQVTALAGVNQGATLRPVNSTDVSETRLSNIKPGGSPADPQWGSLSPSQVSVTYVPTKMQIQISAIPMMSRNDVSNNFSLTDYASGKLLRGLQNVRGGFW